jgi:tRNA pseudouridine55 synthase
MDKKVGHAGTLDPLATGLLIVCTGKFTKKIMSYGSGKRIYRHHNFGCCYSTYDLESEPEQHKSFQHITNEMLMETTKQFTGEIFRYHLHILQ